MLLKIVTAQPMSTMDQPMGKMLSESTVSHHFFCLDGQRKPQNLFFIEDLKNSINEESVIKKMLVPGNQVYLNSFDTRKTKDKNGKPAIAVNIRFSDIEFIKVLGNTVSTEVIEGTFRKVAEKDGKPRVYWNPENDMGFTPVMDKTFDDRVLAKLDQGDEITVTQKVINEWVEKDVVIKNEDPKYKGFKCKKTVFVKDTMRFITAIDRVETFEPEGLEEREECPELWTESERRWVTDGRGEDGQWVEGWETEEENLSSQPHTRRRKKHESKENQRRRLAAEARAKRQIALKKEEAEFYRKEQAALKAAQEAFYKTNPDLK